MRECAVFYTSIFNDWLDGALVFVASGVLYFDDSHAFTHIRVANQEAAKQEFELNCPLNICI
jgi:hypothetical protein